MVIKIKKTDRNQIVLVTTFIFLLLVIQYKCITVSSDLCVPQIVQLQSNLPMLSPLLKGHLVFVLSQKISCELNLF